MNRSGKIVLGLLVATVFIPCLAHEPLTLTVLKDKATADAATAEGKAYLKEFFTNPWMLAFDSADEQCRDAQVRSGWHGDFELGLIIGGNGYPTDALVSPGDEALTCLADRLKASGFIRPPHDGFAIYMPYKLTEPGTEHRTAAPVPGEPSNQ